MDRARPAADGIVQQLWRLYNETPYFDDQDDGMWDFLPFTNDPMAVEKKIDGRFASEGHEEWSSPMSIYVGPAEPGSLEEIKGRW